MTPFIKLSYEKRSAAWVNEVFARKEDEKRSDLPVTSAHCGIFASIVGQGDLQVSITPKGYEDFYDEPGWFNPTDDERVSNITLEFDKKSWQAFKAYCDAAFLEEGDNTNSR